MDSVYLDMIYKIFYTVVLLGIIMCIVVPVAVVLRFILMKMPRKYTAALWVVVFLRALCPISLTSPVSIPESFNRSFHRLTEGLGLEIKHSGGIMTGWRTVFENEINVNISFKICTAIWLIGMIVTFTYCVFRKIRLRKKFSDGENIYENVYKKNDIKGPCIVGKISPKLYIHPEMKVEDMKYFSYHLEVHKKSRDGLKCFLATAVLIVQWFNPFIYIAYNLFMKDMEFAADEKIVRKYGLETAKSYAQQILNIDNKSYRDEGIFSSTEKWTQERAIRLIHMKKNKKRSIFAVLVMFCFMSWLFVTRPLQLLWSDGTWGLGKDYSKEQTGGVLEQIYGEEIASVTTVSPQGIEMVISLVMTDGKHREGEGYTGKFELRLLDSYGSQFYSVNLDNTFRDVTDKDMWFPEKSIMTCEDYNGDGVMEVSVGISVEDSEKGNMAFVMWDVESEKLSKISEEIYVETSAKTDNISLQCTKPEGAEGVIHINDMKPKEYYVWNKNSQMYDYRVLDKDGLARYIKGEEVSGEENEHVLKDSSGKEILKVSTETDESGSEVISDIRFVKDVQNKELPEVKGYFCDVMWVDEIGEEEKYAKLIYNGTKAQTFVVYDTEKGTVYFEQEDGNKIINDMFQKYNGGSVDFIESGVVVYNLMEKEGDTLKISFAASTADEQAVSGNYKYNVATERVEEMSYSQGEE